MSVWTKVRSLFVAPDAYYYQSPEEKTNPAFLALSTYGTDSPQPQLMPRQYRSFAKEGYRVDPTLYKCINFISRNGAAIPPKLYTDATREKEIESHPLLERLSRPNEEMSGVAYREAVMGYLLLAGNSYQYAIRAKGRPPDELWPLRPDMVQVVAGPTHGIIGYQYAPAHPIQGGDMYSAADVAHVKYWSPDDAIYGLSPVEVAAIMLDQQIAARKWNLALLQNWARLPGAWVVPVPMAKNDRDRLEQKLKEKLQGYKNAGTPPVLDGGLTWQSMGVPPAQMDWLAGIGYNAATIANIFNIPPMVIGDTSATTFDNMKQAEVYAYTEGIFPDLDKIYDQWSNWLVPMYPDLCDRSGKPVGNLYYDKETVEVIQEMIQAQKDSQSKRATEMFSTTQVTLNEARELQGMPPIKGGDRLKLGNSLIPLEALDRPVIFTVIATGITEDPAEGPPPEPEPVPLVTPETPPVLLPGAPAPVPTNGAPPTVPAPAPAQTPPPVPAVPGKVRFLGHAGRKASASAQQTYTMWECMSGACDFCLDNDGAIVAEGEDFPNGVSSPEDCHKFCRCQGYTLSISAEVDTSSFSGMSIAAIAALYAVAVIASRHDRDVAAQQQQDEGDDFQEEDYAKATHPSQRRQDPPFAVALRDRRTEYQKFIEETT